MQKSKITDGALVKNSDTTLVKHVLLSMPMSKTHSKITLLTDKLLKTRRKITPGRQIVKHTTYNYISEDQHSRNKL